MRNGIAGRIFLLLALAVWAGGGFPSEALGQAPAPEEKVEAQRTFTDDQGRQITASVVGIQGGNVELRRNPADEKTFTFPIGKLSEEDRAFLKQWFKDNGFFDLRFREKEIRSAVSDPAAGRPGPGPVRVRRPPGAPGPPGGRFGGGPEKKLKESSENGQYEVEIRNASVLDLKGAELVYRVQIKRTDFTDAVGNKTTNNTTPLVFEGTRPIPDLAVGKTIKVTTRPVELFSRKWEVEVLSAQVDSKGGTYMAKETSKYRIGNELAGVDLKVKVGERVVAEYQTEERSAKPLEWDKAGPYILTTRRIRRP